jgi:hypothetical protein
MPEDTTFVASLRYLGTIHLRIEQITPNDADAAHATETLTTLLTLLKTVQQAQAQMQPHPVTDAVFRELTDSTKIEQHKDRAVLTANIPLELVKQLAANTTESQP